MNAQTGTVDCSANNETPKCMQQTFTQRHEEEEEEEEEELCHLLLLLAPATHEATDEISHCCCYFMCAFIVPSTSQWHDIKMPRKWLVAGAFNFWHTFKCISYNKQQCRRFRPFRLLYFYC